MTKMTKTKQKWLSHITHKQPQTNQTTNHDDQNKPIMTSQKQVASKNRDITIHHNVTIKQPYQLGFQFTVGVMMAIILPAIILLLLRGWFSTQQDHTIPYQTPYHESIQQSNTTE